MPEEAQNSVRTRQLFYIPGYDPVPPRRYRELYRKEGAEQAALSGYSLEMKPKAKGVKNFGWGVSAEIDGQKTQTQAEILYWADIVQRSMDQNIPRTYLLLLSTAWEYIGSGALFGLMKLRIGPVLAALYPVAMLLLQLLLALALGGVAYYLSALYLHWGFGVVLGAAILCGVLVWFKRKDAKLFAYYLMHDYGYSARYKGENPPELEARMAEFTDRIAQAMRSDADEVLVVGHSSGAHLAVSILADLLRQGWVPANGPRLGLLTLGQVIPMVSFLRNASRLRADLNYLCQQNRLSWVDVSAPGDGATFALCDPVAVSGVAPETGQLHPLVLSAAFTQTLSEAKRKELHRRFFRLHFQYLCAFDQPKDYDYFKITAGPQFLGDRFAHRSHSPSRFTRAVNPHTSQST
ncbi:MAG: hypothetical protein GYB24_06715 [Rhodobacteraceae bacterium]|nr:hypothetical protein [Paracoccaceae bacterium]